MIVRPVSSRLASRARAGFTLLEVLVVVAILIILASVATFATMRYMEDAKINQASLQMQKIEQGCKAYYSTNGGNWPSSLEELVVPSASGQPLLEGGASALMSPWGTQYQISFMEDSVGAQRLVVFCFDTNGKRYQWPRQ